MDPVSKSAQNRGMPLGRRFVRGQSGNPGGRPKKSLLAQRMEEKANDPEYVARLMEAIDKRTTGKGMAAVLETREILDRVDGKVAQTVEMEVSGKISLESVLQAEQRANGNSDESGLAADEAGSDVQDGSPEIR